MSSAEEELRSLSLSQLFARALTAASDASELNTNEPATQVSFVPPSFRPRLIGGCRPHFAHPACSNCLHPPAGPPRVCLLCALARSVPAPGSGCVLSERAARGCQHPGARLHARRRRRRRDRRKTHHQGKIRQTPETQRGRGKSSTQRGPSYPC